MNQRQKWEIRAQHLAPSPLCRCAVRGSPRWMRRTPRGALSKAAAGPRCARVVPQPLIPLSLSPSSLCPSAPRPSVPQPLVPLSLSPGNPASQTMHPRPARPSHAFCVPLPASWPSDLTPNHAPSSCPPTHRLLHPPPPQLAIGMTAFFALGALGGSMSTLMQAGAAAAAASAAASAAAAAAAVPLPPPLLLRDMCLPCVALPAGQGPVELLPLHYRHHRPGAAGPAGHAVSLLRRAIRRDFVPWQRGQGAFQPLRNSCWVGPPGCCGAGATSLVLLGLRGTLPAFVEAAQRTRRGTLYGCTPPASVSATVWGAPHVRCPPCPLQQDNPNARGLHACFCAATLPHPPASAC